MQLQLCSSRLFLDVSLFIKPFYIRFLQVALPPSHPQHDALYLLRQHHLLPISAVFLFPQHFWFLASALTFISFRASTTPLAATLAVDINKHLDYTVKAASNESWLEAGRLAHRCRREVPLFPFFLPSPPSRASPNFALELHSLFHSAAALPFRSPLSPSTFVTMESIRTLEAAW